MPTSRLRAAVRLLSAAALTLPFVSPAAHAQGQFPTHPITYVVPYTPGGTNDNVARIVSKRLSEKLGQPVVIEYKPGAGGTIGAAYVAKATADGYTLLNASSGNLAIAPQLVKANFDPFTDLVPVAFLGSAQATVSVNPQLPVHTVAELIEYAKAHPGTLSYATSGIGTPGHISGELFNNLAGIDIRHVPYKGSAPAVSDVVAGHVQVVFDPLSTPFVKAGKLRALAYFGGTSAPPDLPNVPSITKAGLRNWEEGLAGAFLTSAPRDVPPPVLAKLRQVFSDLLREPAIVEALAGVQVQAEPLTPEQTTQRLRTLHQVAGRVIQASGARAE
jgi:tripartite-type tricarboxylate transporter receptor subunit TctC